MSISATDILDLLRKNELRIFRTTDIATLTGMSASSATHILERLRKQNLLTKNKRGLWVNALSSNINSFEYLPYLTAPWPSYVSLHSALSGLGIIEEIPHVIYGVTAGAARQI